MDRLLVLTSNLPFKANTCSGVSTWRQLGQFLESRLLQTTSVRLLSPFLVASSVPGTHSLQGCLQSYLWGNMEEEASKHEVRLKLDSQGHGESQPPGQVKSTGSDQQQKMAAQSQPDEGKCSLLVPATDGHRHFDGLYDKPPSCFGCGIGWFCFILGFAFPPLWYIATALYIGKFYLRDPRERAGLAASAIAALICSVAAMIALLVWIF